jgi:hypothetical protein
MAEGDWNPPFALFSLGEETCGDLGMVRTLRPAVIRARQIDPVVLIEIKVHTIVLDARGGGDRLTSLAGVVWILVGFAVI